MLWMMKEDGALKLVGEARIWFDAALQYARANPRTPDLAAHSAAMFADDILAELKARFDPAVGDVDETT
jgi:hypothetical protein